MEQLIKQIEQWANDRNIINGTKPIDQAMKLFSEFGELADNVGKGRDCRDDIGNVFVVLTIMCKQHGESIDNFLASCGSSYDIKGAIIELCENLIVFAKAKDISDESVMDSLDMSTALLDSIALATGHTMQECVQIAYDDIKDQKGIVSNGVFIKESDPAYAQVIAEIENNFGVENESN